MTAQTFATRLEFGFQHRCSIAWKSCFASIRARKGAESCPHSPIFEMARDHWFYHAFLKGSMTPWVSDFSVFRLMLNRNFFWGFSFLGFSQWLSRLHHQLLLWFSNRDSIQLCSELLFDFFFVWKSTVSCSMALRFYCSRWEYNSRRPMLVYELSPGRACFGFSYNIGQHRSIQAQLSLGYGLILQNKSQTRCWIWLKCPNSHQLQPHYELTSFLSEIKQIYVGYW